MLYGNGLISQHGKESGSKLYYHFNNVGSTTAVTDASGNVKYSYEYSPYGELIKGTYGQVMFLYNGQYGVTSDDNGLYYMRARYYNIAIKRFCNQDVLTGEIGESQSLNRYAYVEGNPVSYFDPFGLYKVDTSELHNAVTLCSLLLATLVLGTVLLGVATPLILMVTAETGLFLTYIDAEAYKYDLEHATSYEEEVNAKAGLVGALVSFILSFDLFGDDLVGAIVSYVWNSVYSQAGEANAEWDKY